MPGTFSEWRRHQNVQPLSIPNKEQYYMDLLNIEHSWSGRLDNNICNTFVMEAEQQLVNAIELFEEGYFDCAYYSLRSAVDISTTMVFILDMPDTEKKDYFGAWKDTRDFPMQGQMIKQLSNSGYVFAEMREKMAEFFSDAKKLSAELNKYVHKQGLQFFYISRNHPLAKNDKQEQFVSTFEQYLRRCIGIVAVMRLVVDPFPILLMDEEILYRCFDSLTDPYSEDFVEKYIGASTVECYKQTSMYQVAYDSFIGNEKKNEAVFNVMKHQYIDTRRLEEIFSQFHLLSKDDEICVLLTASNEKVVKLYCYRGLLMYFTDRNTNRETVSWSGKDFLSFSTSENPLNQAYDEAFISVFYFDGTPFFVEHNELLTKDEVDQMVSYVMNNLPIAYGAE